MANGISRALPAARTAACLALAAATACATAEADRWQAEAGYFSPGPRGATFVREAVGPTCAPACAPPTRLVLRCQHDHDGARRYYLGARGEGGRGDSHPRRIVVRVAHRPGGWTTLTRFDAQVYDHGGWLGPALSAAQLERLVDARTIAVELSGEGVAHRSEHNANGLDAARVALGRCAPDGHAGWGRRPARDIPASR